MARNKKGQSTLEYVIVLAAIISAIIIFAKGTFTSRLGNALDNVTNQMQNVIGRIHY